MNTATLQRLHAPLPNLAAWVARFRAMPIPVMAGTAAAIDELIDHEDVVDAHTIAESIGADPLIEDLLDDVPEALAGARAVIDRAHRAARFALGFAAHRLDPDAAVLHEAALLHDFAELLLWCHAPSLALQIARRQADDATLRSADAQRAVLGVELSELQQALMKAWRLPALLIRLGDDHHAEASQVKNVLLAVRVARHSMQGWDNAALPDDVAAVGALLQLSSASALKLLREIDQA
jgi:hypothetical protein